MLAQNICTGIHNWLKSKVSTTLKHVLFLPEQKYNILSKYYSLIQFKDVQLLVNTF